MSPVRRQRGFTLLELLIALLLAGLLATTAFSGLNLGVNSWQRITGFQADYGEMQLVQNSLRRILEASLQERIYDQEGVFQVAMRGYPDRLLLVANNPRHGDDSPHWLLLQLAETAEGNRQLQLYSQPFQRNQQADLEMLMNEMAQDNSPAVLLEGAIESLEFGFLRAERLELPEWYDEWLEQPHLPNLIRLRLNGPDGPLAEDLQVTPKVLIYGIKLSR